MSCPHSSVLSVTEHGVLLSRRYILQQHQLRHNSVRHARHLRLTVQHLGRNAQRRGGRCLVGIPKRNRVSTPLTYG